MLKALAVFAACAALAGAAFAQSSFPAQSLTPNQCQRPSAPQIPERAPIGMSLQQLSALHDARDAYVNAADRYRLCLDDEIVRRRDEMFRTNAEIDPVLDIRAHEHSEISAERAQVMGRFVLMCISWEDAHGAYPRGCYLQDRS
jgi:hypothetical protein